MHQTHYRGMTLIELLLVLAIVGILTAVVVPRVATFIDGIDVRGAADDAEGLMTSARHLAIARAAKASVGIDTGARTLTLQVGGDTLQRRDEGALHGVRLTSNGAAVTYSQIGLGFGVTNLTLVITKGTAAETLFVSKLGRVRR
ncbi:MAG TPA: type II secretion system protein [Gemmatimonadaceae bacterium]|jgi:prepilin-type N-terminal cleavage/methylation domain-containing protein|nr:type II secretion system protein [Gemmatimonadaceae bacterium]